VLLPLVILFSAAGAGPLASILLLGTLVLALGWLSDR
jgi:hypothetical protein